MGAIIFASRDKQKNSEVHNERAENDGIEGVSARPEAGAGGVDSVDGSLGGESWV